MRWKLKDLLAESFNPVRKGPTAEFRHLRTTVSGGLEKNERKYKKRGNSSINKTPKQNREIKSETVKT